MGEIEQGLRRDEIRPKLVKDPAADCLAMAMGGELSCDLPGNHEPPHYDTEYRMSFTAGPPDEVRDNQRARF